MINHWYTKKWVTVSLHVLCWMLFFAFPFLMQPEGGGRTTQPNIFNSNFLFLHIANNLLRVLFFYANAYLFIPYFIYQKKFTQYILALLLSVALLLGFDYLFFSWFMGGRPYHVWNFFVFHIPVIIFLIITSAALRVISDQVADTQRRKEQETENLKTELSFLRSQISPHFIFNILNNMVALARKKSDTLEPSLIKLSHLLRYMLYETDEDRVLLDKEVQYVQNYIDLQQQRFGKKVKIQTQWELEENGYTIEPMLLVPFVENAFKHGTGLIADAEIDIQLCVKNGLLTFSVRNRYSEELTNPKDKTSGIGLQNVKRRLNLLYRENHSLSIEKKDGWYIVTLQLKLI